MRDREELSPSLCPVALARAHICLILWGCCGNFADNSVDGTGSLIGSCLCVSQHLETPHC